MKATISAVNDWARKRELTFGGTLLTTEMETELVYRRSLVREEYSCIYRDSQRQEHIVVFVPEKNTDHFKRINRIIHDHREGVTLIYTFRQQVWSIPEATIHTNYSVRDLDFEYVRHAFGPRYSSDVALDGVDTSTLPAVSRKDMGFCRLVLHGVVSREAEYLSVTRVEPFENNIAPIRSVVFRVTD